MSLRPLNRDPMYMSGDYGRMFDIPAHQGNQAFVYNPYTPAKCSASKAVCFSLINGAIPCQFPSDNIVVWRAMGDLGTITGAKHPL